LKVLISLAIAATLVACAGRTVYIEPPRLSVGVDPVYPVLPTRFVELEDGFYKVHKTTMVNIVRKIRMQDTRIDELKATITGPNKNN
jgi:hypothetical protein